MDEKEVLQAVEDILDGLFVTRRFEERIREHLAETIGQHWWGCVITSHNHQDGYVQWTTSRLCERCHSIHTRIVDVFSNGSFVVAKAVDDEE